MAKQLSDVFGHAQWRLPELQLPHAPPPAEPQGPQAAPQQNHDASAVVGALGSGCAMVIPFGDALTSR
jgi:hypothetical protein